MIKKIDFIKKSEVKNMSELDRWYLLSLATEMLAAAAVVLFPAGKYLPIKWYQVGRLIKLGKIVIVMILKWAKK